MDRLSCPRIQWSIEHLDCVESTQVLAAAQARQGGAEGTVIRANQQLAGQGRHGNPWTSPKGNIYTSFILRPEIEEKRLGELSFLIGAALADQLSAYTEIRLKWPNDILRGHKKIAGILLTKEGDALICGVGVNVYTAPEGAACLSEFQPDIDTVFQRMLENIAKFYHLWKEEGFEPIRSLWLDYAANLGKPVQVRGANSIRHGIFSGIDPDGALKLQTENKIERIYAGAVYF